MPKNEPNDFTDLVEIFNKNKVEFVIVGAHAVAFHGYTRATLDLDILIRSTPKNIPRVLKALEDFGFGSLGLKETDFSPETVVQLGVPPNRVDLMSEIGGVDTEKVWRTRAKGEYHAHPAWYISLECLLKNKKTVGRSQDQLDVEKLQQQTRLAQKRKRTGSGRNQGT